MDKDVDTDRKSSKKTVKVTRCHLLWLILGVLIGLLSFLGYRMAIAKNPNTHYHANFAVYLNGKRDTFEGPGYYEEVAACNNHDANDVKAHAHMHDNVNHTIHAHSKGITWSDFFSNLGYTLGDNLISNGHDTYVDGQDTKHLTFMLNGGKVAAIADQVIKSEDVLLISYGDEPGSTAIQQQYDSIPKDAHKYNVSQDPSTCGGGQPFGVNARFQDALGLDGGSH